MPRRLTRPEGHTLYWVYWYDHDEIGYNFDTFSRFDVAIREGKEQLRRSRGAFDHYYVWYGNKDGPFTQYDPAAQYWLPSARDW